ncbi:UNVERIFIED_CONTAM: hypothetical protein RMT77_010528 [Armadillidium vulgare]
MKSYVFFFVIFSYAIINCRASSLRLFRERRADDPNETQKEFWKRGILMDIYPRSFYDSDGDGIGDIKGITEKSDYLVDLGVEMIWLNPVLKSPMKDFGYDISDFRAIDPIFGTMEDYENMLKEMHSKNIKVIFDFVPNHTSDQHEWFIKSVQNDPKYKDYYVWKDPKGYNSTGAPIPPNNWVSIFRFSAWEWSAERKQFYLHKFLKEQPDLNYRNPEVVKEMNDVIRFWLDKGVDGFRVDAIQNLVEDVSFADEPPATNSGITDPTLEGYYNHIYTLNQPETIDVIRGWHEVLESYKDRFMTLEVYDEDVKEIMKFYGNETNPVSDFPFNFFFINKLSGRSDVTGTRLKSIVDLWLDNMPKGKWPNWVLGNHDRNRVASRFGTDLIDALNMLVLLLPGTGVSYYGDEIGMVDAVISFEDTQDPAGINLGPDHYTETSRDPERTPMQWDDTENAGFSTASKTWIPVNENYLTLNVKSQNEASQSHIKVYKDLAKLRLKKTFQFGTIDFAVATEEVLAFVRSYEGSPTYLVVINTSPEETTVDVQNGDVKLPDSATVVIRSSTDSREETNVGSTVNLSSVSLQGGEGLVLLVEE